MSKLSVSHLFDAMQSLQGAHPLPRTAPTAKAALSAEKLASFFENEAAVNASRLTAGDLAHAIRQTFDLDHDRIVADPIHLLDLPTVPAGRRLRFDSAHQAANESGDSSRADAAGEADLPGAAADSLSTALGIARARDVLLGSHWIVVVVDARSSLSAACLEPLSLLARQRRLLIVWCEFNSTTDMPAVSKNRRALEEMLGQCGLGHLGPLTGLSGGDLASIFQALKTMGQASLVRLRVLDRGLLDHDLGGGSLSINRSAPDEVREGRPAAAKPPRLHRDRSATEESGVEGGEAAIESMLLQAAARDARVVVVDRRTASVETALGAHLDQRYFAADADDPQLWPWCAGLAAGGCRPVLLLPERQWFGAATSLAALPEGTDLRATAIVFGDRRRMAPSIPARLAPRPEATIVAASDLGEFQSLLSFSLLQEGLTVIWAPADLCEPASECAAAAVCLGQAVVEMRGADIAILGRGASMPIARQAARRLSELGISPTLVNLRFLQPLDEETISSVIGAAPVAVVLDEPILGATAATAIAEALSARDFATPIVTFGPPPSAVPAAKRLARIVEHCRRLARGGRRSRGPSMNRRFDAAETAWLDRQTTAGAGEREQILAKRYSPELAPWIESYSKIGQRGEYLWKWCLHGVELTTLACVPDFWRSHACDTKVLAGMLNVLFDDVADQRGREGLLAELLRLTHDETPQLDRLSADDRRYGEFTCEVWSAFWGRAKRYPCYDPYAALLQFDLAQLFNTVHYSQLVNSNPYILNVVEHDDYSPQGMGLLSFAMIDLMCSPDFSVTDLGRLREAMWHAQWMARIGNLITTWQREIKDHDFSSGVFAHAVANRDLTVEQLLTASPAQIERAIDDGKHEAYFLRRWKQHRAHVRRLRPEVKSVDLEAMVRGLERLLQTELASRGKK